MQKGELVEGIVVSCYSQDSSIAWIVTDTGNAHLKSVRANCEAHYARLRKAFFERQDHDDDGRTLHISDCYPESTRVRISYVRVEPFCACGRSRDEWHAVTDECCIGIVSQNDAFHHGSEESVIYARGFTAS